MPYTPYRNWEYPLKGLRPYYIEIVDFYKEIDLDVNNLYNRLDNLSPVDLLPDATKGNIPVGDGSNYTAVPVGSNGYILSADSTQTNGVNWISVSSIGSNWNRISNILSPATVGDGLSVSSSLGNKITLDTSDTSSDAISVTSSGGIIIQANNDISFTDGTSGPHTLQDLLGVSGLFLEGSGTLSAYRDGTTNTTAGDYSFAVGQGNTLAADYSLVTGRNNSITAGDSSVILGYSNTTTSGAFVSQSVIAGNTNNIDTNYAQNSIIAGTQHDLYTVWNSFVIGQNNSNANTSNQIANSIIVGRDLAVANGNSIDYSVVGGYSNSLAGSTSCVVVGQSLSQTAGVYLWYSAIFGQSHTFVDNAGCVVAGVQNSLGINSNYHAIFGKSNEVIDSYHSSLIAGYSNELGLMNVGATISFAIAGSTVTLTDSSNPFPAEMAGASLQIVITGAPSAGNNGTFTATYTSSSTVTYTNASGVTQAGDADTKWIIRTASATGVGGYTAVVGAQNNAYAGGSNFLAGYGNTVVGSIAGAVIGFENSIYAGSNYSVVTGYQNSLAAGGSGTLISGVSNIVGAGDSWCTISGTQITLQGGCNANAVFGQLHDVGGGSSHNLVSGYDCDIQNGSYNVIGGQNNDLGGGCNNNAIFGQNNGIAVGGGGSACNLVVGNTNLLANSCSYNIVGGFTNDIDTTGSGNTSYNIVGGSNNTLLNNVVYSFVGGQLNYVDSPTGSLIVGKFNYADGQDNYALFGYGAKGYFSNSIFIGGGHPTSVMSDYTDAGEGQSILGLPLSGQTVDATPVTLYLDGASATAEITTPDDHAYVITTIVIAKCGTGDSVGGIKSWELITTLNNDSGILSIVGTPVKTVLAQTSVSHEADWDIDANVYSTNKFTIEVTGHANDSDIRWQCTSFAAEVGIA